MTVARFFLTGREDTVPVGIQDADNLLKGRAPMMVPIHFCMDCGVAVAKIRGELHLRVLGVIPADKAADEPNDDHVPDCGIGNGRTYRANRHLLAARDARSHKNQCRVSKNESGELPVPQDYVRSRFAFSFPALRIN